MVPTKENPPMTSIEAIFNQNLVAPPTPLRKSPSRPPQRAISHSSAAGEFLLSFTFCVMSIMAFMVLIVMK